MTAGPRRPFTIPADRLPAGFAERIATPPGEPAEPKPAATAVLVRDGSDGLELLLLRRHRRSGFVPGAWVFPGGRVDPADASPELLAHADGIREPPAPAFWNVAAREAFEETGVLLARAEGGAPFPGACRDPTLEAWRSKLMDDEATLLDVATSLEARLDLRRTAHVAHWITPVVEPRRYDTHFFLAALPEGCEAAADPREMTDALWLTPEAALARFRAGELPMVFPTVDTIERLAPHATVEGALTAAHAHCVRTVLPRLVRTEDGVAIIVDDEDAPE